MSAMSDVASSFSERLKMISLKQQVILQDPETGLYFDYQTDDTQTIKWVADIDKATRLSMPETVYLSETNTRFDACIILPAP